MTIVLTHKLPDVPFSNSAHLRSASVAEMRIVGPYDQFCRVMPAIQVFDYGVERLCHMLVA